MEIKESAEGLRSEDTQLERIRQLMLAVSATGGWLTLSEIAEQTESGETSASAQLRHLRKWRHGRYRVENRYRRFADDASLPVESARPGAFLWEYRVLPPAGTHAEDGDTLEAAVCEAPLGCSDLEGCDEVPEALPEEG